MSDLETRLGEALQERYRIERLLGEGGSGVVFLAEDLKLGRRVALKVLRPEIGREVGSERFEREIRIAAQLSHQNILSLLDSGVADGLLYYVMFYVEGESLRDRLNRERQLSIEDAVRITCEAAEALHHAHEHGLVHRDVKPENILLSHDHALVADFGIAQVIEEAGAERLTHTGVVVGTPAYMSPEQATGDTLDRRSDVYSLACVLFEMLVGGAPFTGITPQALMARKAVEPAPSARVVRDTVPEQVELALQKALARVPADRFPTAADFAAALRGEQIVTPMATPMATPLTHPAAPPARRIDGRSVALAGIAIAAVATVMVLLPEPAPSTAPPTALSSAQISRLPGPESSPSISPDGQWVVYEGKGDEGMDIFLQAIDGQLAINLTEDTPEDDTAPVFSPDGNQIAFRSERDGGGLFVMGRTGEAVRRVTTRGQNPTWSPDGTRIAFSNEVVGLLPMNWERIGSIWITDLDGGEPVRVTGSDGVDPAWSPDGRWIAYASRMPSDSKMDIRLISPDGTEERGLTDDAPADWAAAWSPDGRFVYFVSDRGGSMNLWRIPVDTDDGEALGPPQAVTTPAAFVGHPSVSADGTTVVYTAVRHEQNVFTAQLDAEAGTVSEPRPLTTGSQQWSSPDPSPDGSLVAFYSRDLPEGDLYVIRGDGTGLRQITTDSAIDRMPRFSRDGSRIAYFSNRTGPIQTWSVRPDGSGNQLLVDLAMSSWGSWSPGDERFAFNGLPAGDDEIRARMIRVDDPEGSLEHLPRIMDGDQTFSVNDWSPDGSTIAGMFGLQDTGIVTYDVDTGTHERHTDFGQWPAFLPDSRTVLFVTGGTSFHLLDLVTGEVRKVYDDPFAVAGPPRVTADGRTIVFTRRLTEADVWAVRMEGGGS